jgi:mono/diheme cytochrome c family protein
MALKNFRPMHLVWLAILIVTLIGFNPVLAQAGDETLEEGAALYAENCQVCHGDQGQGRVGATLAKNWPSIRPDLTIKNVIENGVPGSAMPAWSQDKGGPLSTAQIDSLVAYLLSWETGEAFVYVPLASSTPRPPITPLPDMEGDPNRGALLYDENCTVCHGPDGQGRVGATLAKAWTAFLPEASITHVIANGVSGSAMPAWSLANGGPLSDQEIADITAFILSLPQIGGGEGMPTAVSAETTGRMSGVTGVMLTLAVFTLIVGFILFAQRKQPQA